MSPCGNCRVNMRFTFVVFSGKFHQLLENGPLLSFHSVFTLLGDFVSLRDLRILHHKPENVFLKQIIVIKHNKYQIKFIEGKHVFVWFWVQSEEVHVYPSYCYSYDDTVRTHNTSWVFRPKYICRFNDCQHELWSSVVLMGVKFRPCQGVSDRLRLWDNRCIQRWSEV